MNLQITSKYRKPGIRTKDLFRKMEESSLEARGYKKQLIPDPDIECLNKDPHVRLSGHIQDHIILHKQWKTSYLICWLNQRKHMTLFKMNWKIISKCQKARGTRSKTCFRKEEKALWKPMGTEKFILWTQTKNV